MHDDGDQEVSALAASVRAVGISSEGLALDAAVDALAEQLHDPVRNLLNAARDSFPLDKCTALLQTISTVIDINVQGPLPAHHQHLPGLLAGLAMARVGLRCPPVDLPQALAYTWQRAARALGIGTEPMAIVQQCLESSMTLLTQLLMVVSAARLQHMADLVQELALALQRPTCLARLAELLCEVQAWLQQEADGTELSVDQRCALAVGKLLQRVRAPSAMQHSPGVPACPCIPAQFDMCSNELKSASWPAETAMSNFGWCCLVLLLLILQGAAALVKLTKLPDVHEAALKEKADSILGQNRVLFVKAFGACCYASVFNGQALLR